MRETLSTDRFEVDRLFRSAFEFAAIGMALVAPNGRFLRVTSPIARRPRKSCAKAVAEIEKLRGGLLKICAWTKHIEVKAAGFQWMNSYVIFFSLS